MGEFLEGGASAEWKPLASHSVSFAEQNPSEIGTDNWATAERAARDVIRKVQPTSESEERRKQIVDYIQRLFRNCLGAEVFPYGSVPLKTFLPDGDIDLTTFGCANVEDALVDDMKSILEEEERNASSVFVVKDVQLIRAEVKLVKCIVEDIVVDVSFNQIGGLSTLCFLEQVDRLIGKDHLFKRSIILIKAWCYYESRILGAHHGLISTYALETMVLYIFHHFHSTLDGPLAVLYKFLCYFSNFDWETYCISLNGPVRRTSLPVIDVEMPEDSGTELLLSSDFLSLCVGMFSVPSRDGNKKSHGFQQKHLNIFDPLKEINNLGRSVSKGNFYRICSAFSYGARKLARILSQPVDSVANELHKFFPNTMERHRGGYNLDAETSKITSDSHARVMPYHAPHLYILNSKPHQNSDSDKLEGCSNHMDSVDPSTSRDEDSWDLSGDYESYLRCLQYGRWSYENSLGSMHALPLPHLPVIPYQKGGPWEGIVPQPHYKPNGFSYPHHNGLHPSPPVYGLQPILFPKPRGTGMYITNQPPQSYRPPSTHMKGKNETLAMSAHNNGGNAVYPEPSMPADKSSHEPSQYTPHANGVFNERKGVIALDLAEQAPAGTTSVSDKSWQQKSALPSPKTMERSQSSLSREQDRILLESSYHLKDEDDFPPLPV